MHEVPASHVSAVTLPELVSVPDTDAIVMEPSGPAMP
eukprot:CAMPEP_0184429322 /NCGR_PEP_ID=MMETSP0738-20130409/234123_1 /TAXON_ID=385413 /ORGANISM="Thalassiosira miniscula, Strain CCMP1093" /LENGTH=36 /DNA_ID= /DNA_START= /DNA_END= /DNA_ORIENTATION=